MPGGVWGEGNTRDFLAWADACQKNAMQQRGLHLNTSVNFSNISHPKAVAAKEELLNLIQSRRQISVADIYNTMPPDLCANPTTKTLLMQLYYENNLRIEGQQSSNNREGNFLLIFENRQKKEERVAKIREKEVVYKQSNIEDVIDNKWKSSGRRLDFDKFDRPGPPELNISLKKEKPKPKPTVNQKPEIDVRQLMKDVSNVKASFTPPPMPTVKPPEPPKQPIPVAPVLPEIEIKIPQPQLEPIQIMEFKSSPPVTTPKLVFDNDLEFAGLSSFELYLLEMFFLHAASLEKDKKRREYLKTNSTLCKTKGDIVYLEEGNGKNFVVKAILGFLCIFIIFIPILTSYSKNKMRSDAKKEYLRIKKKLDFLTIKNNFKNKYPKVVKD